MHTTLESSLPSPATMARISFSSDFLDTQQQATKHDYREAPVSSDFEFSVTNNTTLTMTTTTTSAPHHHADEMFFKGMLMPLKDDCAGRVRKMMTLRDELMLGEEDGDHIGDLEFGHGVLPQLPKICGRWKERLGLRRPQVFVSKKGLDHHEIKRDGFLGGNIVEDKKGDHVFVLGDAIFDKKTIKEACE